MSNRLSPPYVNHLDKSSAIMSGDRYCCVPVPLYHRTDDDGLTNMYQRIKPGTALYKRLSTYMRETGVGYVRLAVPSTRPHSYDISKNLSQFSNRFPKDYVDEVEAMLAQYDPRGVLCIVTSTNKADLVNVTSLDTYNSALKTLFFQSVQHINPTSPILYLMINQTPPPGKGRFVTSKLAHCCVKHLTVKLVPQPSNKPCDLRLYVMDHINHTSSLDFVTIGKWFNAEKIMTHM